MERLLDIPAASLGPKMRALRDDRRRLFVLWMVRGAPSAAAAARAAGYSDKSEGAKVQAHHLMQDPHILEALHETSEKFMHSLVPRAVHALGRLINDPSHPGHVKALDMLLSRTGFVASTEHKVTVEDRRDPAVLLERVKQLSAQLGIDPAVLLGTAPAPKLIEGEVVKDG